MRAAPESQADAHGIAGCPCSLPFPPPSSSSPPSASAVVRDRQPYLTLSGVDDGFGDPQGRSIIKANDTNTGNLMLNGYNGVWSTYSSRHLRMRRNSRRQACWAAAFAPATFFSFSPTLCF